MAPRLASAAPRPWAPGDRAAARADSTRPSSGSCAPRWRPGRAHGWDQDQRWTLARAAALAARLFGVSYTLRGMSFLLHRIGYSPQVPVHRAVERDEAAIAEWRAVTWAKARG